MGAYEQQATTQVFRPHRLLTVLMALAGALWVGVLGYLCTFDGVPVKTFLSVIFFVLFFAVAVVYYGRSAIVVEGGGVTYRGMVRTLRFGFQDIRKLEVVPGLITVYAIRLPGRPIHFTSLFAHHRRLAELVVERAGLAPLPA